MQKGRKEENSEICYGSHQFTHLFTRTVEMKAAFRLLAMLMSRASLHVIMAMPAVR